MIVKKYLPVRLTFFNPARCLFLLILIGMLFLPPWISTGEGRVSKTKRTVKKQTTLKALKIEDISYHIKEEKELFSVTLNRVYKPKVRYIKGANLHLVIVFTPVVAFEEKDYSTMIEGSKYLKQLRAYYERDKKELRFVLDMNGAADDYSITPVNGGAVFTMEITEAKTVKSDVPATDTDDEVPSDL
jgi:hypothetical protein